MKKVFFQVVKHVTVGAVATLLDLGIFELLVAILGVNALLVKGFSFICSTLVKYGGNKYWAFQKPEHDGLSKEIIQFLIITIVGLGIDLTSFYYATKIPWGSPIFGPHLWQATSVLIAAAVAAVWNFTGYKFLVFKK